VSDAELGRRLGISRQAVNAIVNGRADPTLSRLHQIAAALSVSVRDLFAD
jgi:DNA-binding XRE family transcriptional regulator